MAYDCCGLESVVYLAAERLLSLMAFLFTYEG